VKCRSCGRALDLDVEVSCPGCGEPMGRVERKVEQ
jgi:predicted RNA-binding Zn-ribbon protein involved in translation (DUF1610 family)